MINNIIFKAGYFIRRPNVIHYYEKFKENQWKPYAWLKKEQEVKLSELIQFVYKNVPYYTKLFNQHGITFRDISTIESLNRIPILTKQIIKQNWQDFIPKTMNKIKFIHGSTGGSTGDPLRYRMSIEDYERGRALLYCGWGYGGYELGDKVGVIAGASLIPSAMSDSIKKIQDFILIHRHYSAFEMTEHRLYEYLNAINKWKPDFLRGYATAIYVFARFIRDNDLKLKFQPKAIFTTAEKLLTNHRNLIENVYSAKVFDQYGLNDGGISAFECEQHDGMHICTERAILEVVDKDGNQIARGEGKILATSLYNYALPFIRYDTGDLGIISESGCRCGRETLLLKEIGGRVTDFLQINNTIIGSPVLTVLMGKFDIDQYQIIQEDHESITCMIVKGRTYKVKDEEFIRNSFYSHVGKINIKFNYVESFPKAKVDKHKFIINKLKED